MKRKRGLSGLKQWKRQVKGLAMAWGFACLVVQAVGNVQDVVSTVAMVGNWVGGLPEGLEAAMGAVMGLFTVGVGAGV